MVCGEGERVKTDLELRMTVQDVDEEVLSLCRPGDWVKLWSRDDIDTLYIYVRGSIGGMGRICSLPKFQVPALGVSWRVADSRILEVVGRDVLILFTWSVDESDEPAF